jgi:hypothetical protein
LAIHVLECCAAAATSFSIPYEPRFWRDWRTNVRLGYLDDELRSLLETRDGVEE